MAETFYLSLLAVDLPALDGLAERWETIHRDIKGLGKRMHDEVLTPLRDKVLGRGGGPVRLEDDRRHRTPAGERRQGGGGGAARRRGRRGRSEVRSEGPQGRTRRAKEKGLHIKSDGTLATDVIGNVCKVELTDEEKATIEAADQEMAQILGRGVTADRNLAHSLMADLGLGQWFNSNPEFTDIDSTKKISESAYNALDLALQGKNPYPGLSSDDPYSLGWDWVTGDGPRHRDYYHGDEMTELIRSSQSMEQLRLDTLEQWRSTGQPQGSVAYSISESGKLDALKKLITTDLPAIVTGDEEHLGEAFTGSYNLNYTVKGQAPDGSLVVEYTMKNNTSNESFLHYVGYYEWLEKFNREEGVFSSVDQKIVWTERIPAKEK
ncbi:hypothetical protein [Streptomyces hydrogenans]|uniref:hypothetical protein n=1 Tax=Streptomyces hydrogenans TaxID=1873719 RepID=UPI0035D76C51